MVDGAAVIIQIDDLVNSIEQKLQSEIHGGSLQQTTPTIYRVLTHVRKDDPTAYDPKIISIGPFHRDINGRFKPMEHLKRRSLLDLLARSPKNMVRKYVEAISEKETLARARKHYSEEISMSGEEFVEMLLLDGCFILEYLIKRGLGKIEGHLSTVNWNLPLLRNDLLLLENQIPFSVLQILFNCTSIPLPFAESAGLESVDSHVTLMELALNYLTRGKMSKFSEEDSPQVVHHLLHLYHISMNPALYPDKPRTFQCHQWVPFVFKMIKKLIITSFIGLIYFFVSLYRLVTFRLPLSPCSPGESSRIPRMIPSATELTEAGILLKKNKREDCFLKVSFFDGTLEIPFLPVDESTIAKFLNLVAFEQCCPNSGSYFTSYSVFMDNIINTPADVAVLRSCGIIETKLGSDEEVAEFFNTLRKGCYLDYQEHYLADLFKEVKEYCGSDLHRWRAKLVRDYFSNPWAIISLVAAFILLLLTGGQTFFAVYGYFRPPSPSSG